MNSLSQKSIVYGTSYLSTLLIGACTLVLLFDANFFTIILSILNISAYKPFFRFATPLLLSALSVALAGRAGLLNIGVEGQIYLGAFFAAVIGHNNNLFYEKYILIHLFVMTIFSISIPAAVSASCGWIKSRFKIHEVPTTLFSYLLIVAVLNYAVNLSWFSDPKYGPQTYPISNKLLISNYFRVGSIATDILTFSIAIFFVIVSWVLIERTIYGLRLRGLGQNPVVFSNIGYESTPYYVSIMFASGIIASVVGILRVCGQDGRFIENFSPGFGFIGLGIAFAANNKFLDLFIITMGLAQLQCCVSQWRHINNLPFEYIDLIHVFFIVIIVLLKQLFNRYFNND